jgi:hypothetical protein
LVLTAIAVQFVLNGFVDLHLLIPAVR